MPEPVLSVRDLRTEFFSRAGPLPAVDGVSFQVQPGEILGLVGESGSGKSVTCLSLLQMIPRQVGRVAGGEAWFGGRDLLAMSEAQIQRIRGGQIAMILQDPIASLNPVLSIGDQVGEPLRLHQGLRGTAVVEGVVSLLNRVKIPSPRHGLGSYPHQYSGGMRQRVSIAMGFACQPALLFADEPTTALDVTIQAQILRLLRQLRDETGAAIILVTHDFGIVARTCDRVAVMYAGKIVETADVYTIMGAPAHPYTEALMASIPRLGQKTRRLVSIEGQPPSPGDRSPGCPFAPRCAYAHAVCREETPPDFTVTPGHVAACWRHAAVWDE